MLNSKKAGVAEQGRGSDNILLSTGCFWPGAKKNSEKFDFFDSNGILRDTSEGGVVAV
jgi:hypothetical protein